MYGGPRSGLPNPLQKASVTDGDYQEFYDDQDTFELRVFPGTSLSQGRPFVMWDDILDAFPKASRLHCGKRIVGFMADADGNRLQPLRIEYQPHWSVEVIADSRPSPWKYPSSQTGNTSSLHSTPSPPSSLNRLHIGGHAAAMPLSPLSPAIHQKTIQRLPYSPRNELFNHSSGQGPSTPRQFTPRHFQPIQSPMSPESPKHPTIKKSNPEIDAMAQVLRSGRWPLDEQDFAPLNDRGPLPLHGWELALPSARDQVALTEQGKASLSERSQAGKGQPLLQMVSSRSPRAPQLYNSDEKPSNITSNISISMFPLIGSALDQRDKILSESSLSDEAKTRYRSSVNLYQSSLQCVQEGQTAQGNLIRNEFFRQFQMLQAEMAKNQELQRQMLEMRESIAKIDMKQQQTLDQLADIQIRIQAVLTQNFELHEYPLPRLFVILPKDSSAWDSQNLLRNTLQLRFLCECGEHTNLSQDSKIPHHIHLAKHEGYEISRPIEFFGRFGSYIMVLLQMLKFGISVAGFVVPALGQSSGVGAEDKINYPFDNPLLKTGINQAMDYLEYLLNEDGRSITFPGDARYDYKKGELEAVQETDLRLLGTFLKKKDTNQVLGNLYRIVTGEGYAKWVCLDHYRETCNLTVIKNMSDAITVNRGTFDEFRGRVEGSLLSATAATQFYKALEWGKFIQELKVKLVWDVSMNDLKVLRDVVLQANICTFDLTCVSSNIATIDILSRGKRSNPLWQIMMGPKMQNFSLHDYTGFFLRVTIPATTTNLRVLKITERIDWKRDGPKAIELLENCPHLKELHLSSSEVAATYTAIKSINYDFCTLEHLTLEGPRFSGLRAQFKGAIPDTMDPIVFDLSDPLLKDVRVLRSLHVRPDYVKANFDTQPLAGIISRNLGLTTLVIQCETADFIKLHIAVKEALGCEETSMLQTFKLHCHRNKLTVRDLQGITSVELELLSSKVPRDVIATLIKVYGTQLTKITIDGDALNSLLELTRAGASIALRHIEIETSGISYEMLNGLRHVVQISLPTLLELVVLVDRTWEATITERRNGKISISPYLADLVVEFGPQWTKISVNDAVAEEWVKAFEQRGFYAAEDVLKLTCAPLTPRNPETWMANVVKLMEKENALEGL